MTDTDRIKRLAEWMGKRATRPFSQEGDIYLVEEIKDGEVYTLWDPTRIQDAWMLVEQLVNKAFGIALLRYSNLTNKNPTWTCDINKLGFILVVHADTAPKAICQAIEKLMEND
jgi:hypothetical protein